MPATATAASIAIAACSVTKGKDSCGEVMRRAHPTAASTTSRATDVMAATAVTVNEASVVLSGSVSDRYAKRRAEDIAESVRGVHDVQNKISVS